jgi:acyl-coenzyme A thioesterase PaaI-like protein
MGPHYESCFGCGPAQPHGLHLQTTLGEGVSVTAQLTVTESHQGAPGLAHGGVIAAALDETLGALLWVVRQPGVTGRLSTSYHRPVPVGSTLHLVAECTGVDGRKIYAKAIGRLDAPDGPLAARAEAIFIAVPLDHFTPYAPAAALRLDRFEYNP